MIDSCSARKLEPGLAHTYSNPSDLRTSTIKSEPGWSAVSSSTPDGGSVSFVTTGALPRRVGEASCAFPDCVLAATVAPPAALFRKLRRFRESLRGLAITPPLQYGRNYITGGSLLSQNLLHQSHNKPQNIRRFSR